MATRDVQAAYSDDVREYRQQHDDEHWNAEKPKNTGTKHDDLLGMYWELNEVLPVWFRGMTCCRGMRRAHDPAHTACGDPV